MVPGSLNNQYILEGLTAGGLSILGGLALVLADVVSRRDRDRDGRSGSTGSSLQKPNPWRHYLAWTAAALVGVALLGLRALMFVKMPHYMEWSAK